jgi:hypothetical protein
MPLSKASLRLNGEVKKKKIEFFSFNTFFQSFFRYVFINNDKKLPMQIIEGNKINSVNSYKYDATQPGAIYGPISTGKLNNIFFLNS